MAAAALLSLKRKEADAIDRGKRKAGFEKFVQDVLDRFDATQSGRLRLEDIKQWLESIVRHPMTAQFIKEMDKDTPGSASAVESMVSLMSLTEQTTPSIDLRITDDEALWLLQRTQDGCPLVPSEPPEDEWLAALEEPKDPNALYPEQIAFAYRLWTSYAPLKPVLGKTTNLFGCDSQGRLEHAGIKRLLTELWPNENHLAPHDVEIPPLIEEFNTNPVEPGFIRRPDLIRMICAWRVTKDEELAAKSKKKPSRFCTIS